MTVAIPAAEARRLCADAGLVVISADECATYTLVRVEPLPIERGRKPISPETVVKRLWAGGVYAVQIGVENGVDIVTLAAKAL